MKHLEKMNDASAAAVRQELTEQRRARKSFQLS
jgi:hypothetical protein